MDNINTESLVTIAKFSNDFDANLALTKLRSQGIDCILNGEQSAGVWGGALGMTFTPIRLMTRREDCERALGILRDIADK